jgi:membrane-associated protease RseP (regulator of RpoE activity)
LRLDFQAVRRRKPRYWLHVLLFLLTLLTTTVVGARMAESFYADQPAVDLGQDLFSYIRVLAEPSRLVQGLPFSLALLAILLAHEMGHYLACTYYHLDATLPYFLPSPTLIGTLGAFIRIRAPIYSKRVLFDVGIAGPVAGFVFLLPALTIGLAYSRIVPGIAQQGDLIFGTPVVFRLFEWLIFPGTPSSDISLHPVARAAWVGVFATALNLLPIGQLDGGHILYAFAGERHRLLSRVFVAALIPMGLFQYRGGQFLIPGYWPWIIWAAILFFFGLRHPMIYDSADVGPARKKLGVLALLLFVLSFMLAPIETAPGP